MNDDILEPCPFCGSKAEFGSIDDNEHPDFGGHFIYCTNALCQCSSALIFPLMDNVEGLLATRWNKRHQQIDRDNLAENCDDYEDFSNDC